MQNPSVTIFSEQASQSISDEVSDHDFLRGVADLFAAGRDLACCLYLGAGCDPSRRIEVAGKLPAAALKGLRRIGRRDEAPLLGWRQGESCSAPLFALDSVGHLADLLAEARGVRA